MCVTRSAALSLVAAYRQMKKNMETRQTQGRPGCVFLSAAGEISRAKR